MMVSVRGGERIGTLKGKYCFWGFCSSRFKMLVFLGEVFDSCWWADRNPVGAILFFIFHFLGECVFFGEW